jgi:predicted RNase H-like nuclease (RuvC/YqgF family)
MPCGKAQPFEDRLQALHHSIAARQERIETLTRLNAEAREEITRLEQELAIKRAVERLASRGARLIARQLRGRGINVTEDSIQARLRRSRQ